MIQNSSAHDFFPLSTFESVIVCNWELEDDEGKYYHCFCANDFHSLGLPCFCCGTDSQAPVSSSFVEEPFERPFLDDVVDHSFNSSWWLLDVDKLFSESVLDPGPSNTAWGEHPAFSPFNSRHVIWVATGSVLSLAGLHSQIAPSIRTMWSPACGPAEDTKCFGKVANEVELLRHPCCSESCVSAMEKTNRECYIRLWISEEPMQICSNHSPRWKTLQTSSMSLTFA